MSKIIVRCTEKKYYTALVDDGKLIEILCDDKENSSIVGNIYVGVVKTVLPSQFVFIDIGQEKNAFLYLNDSKDSHLYDRAKKKSRIKQGDTILVQVLKDELGEKGAYVTSKISVTGVYGVITKSTGLCDVGVSKKISSESERQRLKNLADNFIAKKLSENQYEIVLRTNAEGKNEELVSEMTSLLKTYNDIMSKWGFLKAPCIAHTQTQGVLKGVSELFCPEIDEIIIDDNEQYNQLISEQSSYADVKTTFYNDEIPIYKNYFLETQIQKALHEKVWLKSGGFLVIQQTEACVVIDVNSGKFAGKRNHEKSVLKVNIEAADEIAYQIRLRNLSGIIIVDFIDMSSEDNVNSLINHLKNAVKNDRLPVNIVGMTELGLMQITRKKTRTPLTAYEFS